MALQGLRSILQRRCHAARLPEVRRACPNLHCRNRPLFMHPHASVSHDRDDGACLLQACMRWAAAPLPVRAAMQRCYATEDSAAAAPKAALLVIGDEILSGSITDTNTPWLAKLLHRCVWQPAGSVGGALCACPSGMAVGDAPTQPFDPCSSALCYGICAPARGHASMQHSVPCRQCGIASCTAPCVVTTGH